MNQHLSRWLAGIAMAATSLAYTSAGAQDMDSIQIHYNRCDKNYAGWGLHTWTDSGTPLPGIDWKAPLAPTAESDFGVIWQMKAEAYGKGKVNYIIHHGDVKEQNGRDMKFDPATTKEIWVNDTDAAIYTSRADAQAAREAKPCK